MAGGACQLSVGVSFRLYSGRRLGYSVPTVKATLYIMSIPRDGVPLVYQVAPS